MAGGGDSKGAPNVKAGLQFPVGKTARRLKEETSPQFTDYAAVYLASSLEYLTAEFIELSGHAAMKEKAKMIEPRHLYSAVKNDEELNELLHKLKIDIDNNEEEEVNGEEDEEYNYNSDDEDEDKISSDIANEEDVDDDQECESVVVGQMSISPDRIELYTRLIDKFGEIVSPNLPKYKVEPTCVVLADLLNLVDTMLDITPHQITQEMVSDWEGTVSFYGDIGLKLGWLEDRVHQYRDWLVDVNQIRGQVAAKQEELEEKRKQVSTLESELQELSARLETQSQFSFSFFDQ